MSTATERIPREKAIALAEELIDLLAPYCERLAIAGSLRRGSPDVGDIELVAIPRVEPVYDLLGDTIGQRDVLHENVTLHADGGTFIRRLDVNGRPRFGRKTKYLFFRGVPFDLFAAEPDNWGLIWLIRTGPGEFNKRLLTPWSQGGDVLPIGMRCEGGFLWRGDQKLLTFEEPDVFEFLGIPYIEPKERR